MSPPLGMGWARMHEVSGCVRTPTAPPGRCRIRPGGAEVSDGLADDPVVTGPRGATVVAALEDDGDGLTRLRVRGNRYGGAVSTVASDADGAGVAALFTVLPPTDGYLATIGVGGQSVERDRCSGPCPNRVGSENVHLWRVV